jgi:hypothetical protein
MDGALGYERANAILARRKAIGRPWILLAQHVPPGVGEHIAKHGGQFVDAVGNCHIVLGDRYVAHVEGRSPVREPAGKKPLRAPGIQVLLAALAQPELAAGDVRSLADQAGTSKSTAANVLRQLRTERRLTITEGNARLAPQLWDTFAVGYAEMLYPKWLIGRFRAQEQDPLALEERLASILGKKKHWAFGGGAASHRMIGHYHGPETVLHVQEVAEDLPQRLRLLPDRQGPVHLIHTPTPVALAGPIPHVATPVLAYAELVRTGDDRALETAAMLRARYQKGPP